MQTIGDRIRNRRKDLGLTQSSLGKRVGISAPAISQLEKGESKAPSSENLLSLANALNCSPNWLQNGIDTPASIASVDFEQIPVLNVELSAGVGSYIEEENIIDWVPISQDWIYDNHLAKKDLAIVKVAGDSMIPRLQDGDMLLINTADRRATSGNIYAIEVEGELRVKRLMKRMDGSWAISSDNKSDPAYQDEIISHHNLEQLRVIGRAVRVLMGKL